MAQARFWTAQQILDQAAIEVGLSAPGATVYANTDANIIRLRGFLNTAGLDLTLMHRWPYPLTKEHTITVANPGDTGTYTLPDDWNGIVDETGYDRTSSYRLIPVGPDEWQYIKANTATASVDVKFRLDSDTLRVETVPADGTVLALEYHSRWWVKPNGQALPNKDTCTAATDVVYFDSQLILALVKFRFQGFSGEDTTSALADFSARLSAVKGRNAASAPIPLGGSSSGFRFLDQSNLPDTGFGS